MHHLLAQLFSFFIKLRVPRGEQRAAALTSSPNPELRAHGTILGSDQKRKEISSGQLFEQLRKRFPTAALAN